MVRPPRFEPGSPAWEASVLTKLDYGRTSELLCGQTKKAFSNHRIPLDSHGCSRKLKSGYELQFPPPGSGRMRRRATIHLGLDSEKLAETILVALLPETKRPATSRSRVQLEVQGCRVTIRIEANDTSALRATLNSYLRWVTLIKNTYSATVDLEVRRKNP